MSKLFRIFIVYLIRHHERRTNTKCIQKTYILYIHSYTRLRKRIRIYTYGSRIRPPYVWVTYTYRHGHVYIYMRVTYTPAPIHMDTYARTRIHTHTVTYVRRRIFINMDPDEKFFSYMMWALTTALSVGGTLLIIYCWQ